MLQNIDKILEEARNFHSDSPDAIEAYRIKYLGKKGIITELFNDFKRVPPGEKKLYGAKINELKDFVSKHINLLRSGAVSSTSDREEKDLTLPGHPLEPGTRHPVSIVRNEIIGIFIRQGFTVSEGPEIEDDWHVFSALNFAEEHPARDMQDTFFIEKNPDILLRTHTSSVQVRVMEKEKPPVRTISPGRVFRNEAISARAHCIFHQVEGLYIDRNVSFADLKQILLYFAKEMFGADTMIRLRPSYFPFTEPSAEMDISCKLCNGKG
ncbi:MAG TPA: phenylalanine--tRNA ligase subunit alpha, partial [Bacteroidaceae bacterium]|nr:phenylalanine--tRNA ligase subunit alpha [Bacteroidaceae bacterium]